MAETRSNPRDYKIFFRHAPPDQTEELKQFRSAHPEKTIHDGNLLWRYLSGGKGENGLLLLTGSIGIGEELFPYFSAFENQYHVVMPFYPPATGIRPLKDGILHILDDTGIRQFSILGQSLGGMIAQALVRRCPQRVDKLILSHTSTTSPPVEPKIIAKLFQVLKSRQRLARFMLPDDVRSSLLNSIERHITNVERGEKEFWKAYFAEIVSYMSKELIAASYQYRIDFWESFHFTPDDLKYWLGKILILESTKDLEISPSEREALKSLYPKARVYTSQDTGHLALYLNQDKMMPVIKEFLNEG